jgi:trypsin
LLVKRVAEKLSVKMVSLCVGLSGGCKPASSEDSGGPLQADGILAVVVSWGNGCRLPDYPGVYARVSTLRQFIQNITEL